MNSTTLTAFIAEDMTDPINAVALPVFAIFSILIMYIPLHSFYIIRSFPGGNIVFVAIIQNLMILTNALIWKDGDMANWYNGAGICDIQVYLRIPSTTAVATSLFAFTRDLAFAVDMEQYSNDSPERMKRIRRRRLVINIVLCWTLPVIQMGLMYLILSNRYNIIPVYGCIAVTDASWLSILILIPWAPLCTLLGTIKAVQIFGHLLNARRTGGNILSSNNSGMSKRQYIRLFLLASSLIVVVLPVEMVYTTFMIEPEYFPYSFTTIHNPEIWPLTVQLPTSASPRTQYTPWVSICLSFLVFFFFGFTNVAIDHYRKLLVIFGFGSIWPTLKETREERNTRHRENSTPDGFHRSSGWRGTLDLVSYVQKHFEGGDRKGSQVITLGGTPRIQSRKNSQATYSNVALTAVASNTSSQSDMSTSAPYRSFFDEVDIEHAVALRVPAKLPRVVEEPSLIVSAPPPVHRGILGTWRTHLSMPFPFFRQSSSRKSASTQSGLEALISSITSQYTDSAPRNKHNSRKSSLATPTFRTTTTSTTIWSDPESFNDSTEGLNSQNTTQARIHASHPSDSSDASVEIDDSLDPLSPKLGSRAYRERERREIERNRKEETERKRQEAAARSHIGNV